jgi:glucosyl-3-phosphoglycerate synthase
MAVDIVTTLMNALIIEEGLEISDTFFRDLTITYQAVAEELIKKYSDDAGFSNLTYDRDREEGLVKNVFCNSIMHAGEELTSPFKLTERFLRFISSHPEFQPYVDQGLTRTILEVEAKTQKRVFETPTTVSWERVSNKLPKIYLDLIEVVEEEKRRFRN